MERGRAGIQMKEEERPKSAMPYHEKYMLTIKESAEYFNAGTKMLRRIAKKISVR